MDCSLPGFSVHGILQARTLEWVAISFSSARKWKVKVKSLSCVQILATPWTAAYQAPPSMRFSRQQYWSGVPLPSPTKYPTYPQLGASLVAQTGKNLPAMQETQVRSLGMEDPWRREWRPTPVFLPRRLHGQRSLANYSPGGLKESDMTE